MKKSYFVSYLSILLNLSFSSVSIDSALAGPSEVLLKSISRHAVQARRSELPTLLTNASKTEVFVRTIKLALSDIEKQNSDSLENDRKILTCFMESKTPIKAKGCDEITKHLALNLLFENGASNPKWFSKVGLSNPSYREAIEQYPMSVLKHDTSIRYFAQMLELKRIGRTVEESESLSFCDEIGRRILVNSFSLPLSAYGGTFVEWFSDAEDLEKVPFYRQGGVRLVLKSQVLQRWDYHITSGWNGSRFASQLLKEGGFEYLSFGPAQINDFFKEQARRSQANLPSANEIIFYNPIGIEDVQEIVVPLSGEKVVTDLLKQFHLEFKIRVVKNESITGNYSEALAKEEEIAGLKKSSSEDEQKSQKIMTHHLELIRDSLEKDKNLRSFFESTDDGTRRQTFENLGRALVSGQMTDLSISLGSP